MGENGGGKVRIQMLEIVRFDSQFFQFMPWLHEITDNWIANQTNVIQTEVGSGVKNNASSGCN